MLYVCAIECYLALLEEENLDNWHKMEVHEGQYVKPDTKGENTLWHLYVF